MKKELPVSGMRCPSCELLVTEALEALEGVQTVEASHQRGVVTVEYDPLKTGVEAMKKVIGEEGFRVIE